MDEGAISIEHDDPAGDAFAATALVVDDRVTSLYRDGGVLEGFARIVEDGTPENTRLAYERDWAYFQSWARARGVRDEVPIAIDVAVAFIVDHMEGPPSEIDRILVGSGAKRDFGPHSIHTIVRRCSTLSVRHRVAGFPSPFVDTVVRDLLAKSRRAWVARGNRQRRAAAADGEVVRALLATCGRDARGVRDAAMILVGFSSGGRRRSELAAALVSQIVPVGQNYRFDMGVSKRNQEGRDDPKPVKGTAATALRSWLEILPDRQGYLFRSVDRWGNVQSGAEPMDGGSVSRMLKSRATAAGLDPRVFSGHSMRAGFVTECGQTNVPIFEAMSLTGHADVKSAMRYYRAGDVMRSAAADLL